MLIRNNYQEDGHLLLFLFVCFPFSTTYDSYLNEKDYIPRHCYTLVFLMGLWFQFLAISQLFHLLGALKPFYSAYSLVICFEYKNNLVDTWVNITLAAESLIKKALSILSVCSTMIVFKAWFLETACQVNFTIQGRFFT